MVAAAFDSGVDAHILGGLSCHFVPECWAQSRQLGSAFHFLRHPVRGWT